MHNIETVAGLLQWNSPIEYFSPVSSKVTSKVYFILINSTVTTNTYMSFYIYMPMGMSNIKIKVTSTEL